MTLLEAIAAWDKAALDPTITPALADSCRRTAKSIRIELETGIAHCGCHFQPYPMCPSRIKNRILIRDEDSHA